MRVTYKDHPDDLNSRSTMADRSMEILEAAGALDRWAYPIEESSFAVHLRAPAAWAKIRSRR